LLVTQAILCRFICESEISESKIFFSSHILENLRPNIKRWCLLEC
jgi:hypothetical protein